MESELALGLIYQTIIGAFLLFPLWKIYSKTGKNPVLSLFVFLPYIGFLMVSLILAFSRWPATELVADSDEQEI